MNCYCEFSISVIIKCDWSHDHDFYISWSRLLYLVITTFISCDHNFYISWSQLLYLVINLVITTIEHNYNFCMLVSIVLPAKDDLWQSLSYVASWNGGPRCLDSYGWLRGERRACHNEVITRPAGLKFPVWQLWMVSIATDCKQWPWLDFCQNHTSIVALWLDTFILCLTSSIFRSSLAHLFRDHLWVELLYNVSHCCFIALKIKMHYQFNSLKTNNVILWKHFYCTKQCYYMVILGNYLMPSFIRKSPFFLYFVLQMHVSIWSPCPRTSRVKK